MSRRRDKNEPVAPASSPADGTVRLQKVLAQAGVASRRACEQLIVEGRVKVNGQVCAQLGTKVNAAADRVEVDGEVVSAETIVGFLLHKPTSVVTTMTDPEGRRTVHDLMAGVSERVFPVGRLDYDTTGLLLLSNDGRLTHRLLHPSHLIEKVYRVTVLDIPEKGALEQLRSGVPLEDGMTEPADVHLLRSHPRESVLEVTIHEGRNRQVRRMFETVGLTVKRLKRVQFGPLELGQLAPGKWRPLTREEWHSLYSSVELPPPPYPTDYTDTRMEKSRTVHRNRYQKSGARQDRSGPRRHR